MKTLIVVPARYGSKRFPGKPLAQINGISMLRRTASVARNAASKIDNCDYVVATDDKRIKAHCDEHNINCVMTPAELKSGSDRALDACKSLENSCEIDYTHIINLQGDAPFTPVTHIDAIHKTLSNNADVATPYIELSWEDLDTLRGIKKTAPFSGTALIKDQHGRAMWFSKTIIPAIRNESKLRTEMDVSPILRHIGLYGYKKTSLMKFTASSEGRYEKLEGLEQLRFLENGTDIIAVQVQPSQYSMQGIDTQEDVVFAERLIAQHGDPFK